MDGPTRSPWAELVVRYRRSARLSQGDLAARCGMSERALRNIESGATARPRRHTVRAIGTELGLDGERLARFEAAARVPELTAPPVADLPTGGDLIGRRAELSELVECVAKGRHRVISVTGPAGVGKSRLAGETVAVLRSRLGPDIRCLDLSGTHTAAAVPELVAEALGAGGRSRLDPLDRIVAELRASRIVLVLDSFERVGAAAPWIRSLSHRCPGLTVIATSQVRLGVDGEHELPLAELPLPAAGSADGTDVRGAAAMDLFLRRAIAARPELATADANKPELAAICRAVGGLPLALELAAARLRVLSPAELHSRLSRPLDLLAGGPVGVPARHRSLRAAIESSVEIVSSAARELLGWLGACPGGVLLADLEAVADALGRAGGWVLDPLGELVEARIVAVSTEAAASRYRLAGAIGEYARESLDADPRAPFVYAAVSARYLRHLPAARAVPAAGSQPDRDRDNIRAALIWTATHAPDLLEISTVDDVYELAEITGQMAEGQAVLTAIGHSEASAAVRAVALLRAAKLAATRHELDPATALADAALNLLDPADHDGHSRARLLLAEAAAHRGDLAGSAVHIGYVLASARDRGDSVLIGRCLNNLGHLALQRGDLAEADRLLSEALPHRAAAGDPVDVACTLSNLAETVLERGDPDRAAALAAEIVALTLPAGRRRMAADALTVRALALLDLGDPDSVAQAGAAARQAWDLIVGSSDDLAVVGGLIGLRRSVVLHVVAGPEAAGTVLAEALPRATRRFERVDIATMLERHALLLAPDVPMQAARLLGAAGRYRNDPHRPVAEPDQRRALEAGRRCGTALGQDRYRDEYAAGATLDPAGLAALCATLGRVCPVVPPKVAAQTPFRARDTRPRAASRPTAIEGLRKESPDRRDFRTG